jgi:hypothetical protein
MEGKKVMISKIEDFIKDSISFFFYLLRLIKHRGFSNKLMKDKQGKVAVLANGPSLKEVIPRLTSDEFKDVDFIVLNFFAFDDVFFQIRPQHYCFADPMFFNKSKKEQDVQKLFYLLEKNVDWKMNIYVPSYYYKKFRDLRKLTNLNLQILKVNSTEYFGYEIFRHFFYKKGLAIPRFQTVAILAIFVCLNKGYSDISLYGVDHTFFDISINKYNQLCSKDGHFYDNNPKWKIMQRINSDEPWKISDYLWEITEIFKAHDHLADYMRYLNVEITNCTKCSMIDSYKRIEETDDCSH